MKPGSQFNKYLVHRSNYINQSTCIYTYWKLFQKLLSLNIYNDMIRRWDDPNSLCINQLSVVLFILLSGYSWI